MIGILGTPVQLDGSLIAEVLADNRVISLQPLTGDRWRLCIARPLEDGSPNLEDYEDGF